MDTFGQCGLPLIVIHKRLLVIMKIGQTVISQENMVKYLDCIRKKELMESVVMGHVVGRQLHRDGGRRVFESG